MSILSELIHGKNGKVSLTKAVAWLGGLLVTIQTADPALLTTMPAWLVGLIKGGAVILGGIGVKNAIDKTASPGSSAAPPS